MGNIISFVTKSRSNKIILAFISGHNDIYFYYNQLLHDYFAQYFSRATLTKLVLK